MECYVKCGVMRCCDVEKMSEMWCKIKYEVHCEMYNVMWYGVCCGMVKCGVVLKSGCWKCEMWFDVKYCELWW